MEKLTEVRLEEIYGEAVEQVSMEVKDDAIKAVRHALYEAHNAAAKVERLTHDLAKAKAVYEKSMDRLRKIKAGDWSAMPEVKVSGDDPPRPAKDPQSK